LTQLPILLLFPVAGASADHIDRRAILLATQIAGASQAVALTLAAAANALTVPMALGLSLLLGVVNAFDLPARQSIVPRLLDQPQHIGNAVALSSAALHLSRLLGPAIAAILLAQYDVTACFGFNALSYLASTAALLRVGSCKLPATGEGSLDRLRALWRLFSERPEIGRILRIIFLTSLLAIPYTALLPAVTHLWTGARAAQYARIMAAAGVGSLAAALGLAYLRRDTTLRRAIPIALLLSGICLMAMGTGTTRLPSWGLYVIVITLGFSLTWVISGSNVAIQHQVPEALRGRVMALFVMSFNGIAALGNLAWGSCSDRVGIALTFLGAGVLVALVALVNIFNSGASLAHRES
jgi:MFS family permease